MNCEPRLRRLLGTDGFCFDVAIDHGVFNTPGFLAGIEDMGAAVETIADAGPDALQLTPGQARWLQYRAGRDKPSLVLRVDVANVYGPDAPPELFCELMDAPVETALRLDAACVVVNLMSVPGHTALHRQCVQNVIRLTSECARFGMPLLVEPIAMKPDGKGGYAVDGDADTIVTLVRQAVELGADLVKVDPTDEVGDYPRVIEAAGSVPVLVRGGGKASEFEIFRRTREVMDRGASGIVYGRNVIQHPDPKGMTEAFMAIVHDGADATRAASMVRSEAGS